MSASTFLTPKLESDYTEIHHENVHSALEQFTEDGLALSGRQKRMKSDYICLFKMHSVLYLVYYFLICFIDIDFYFIDLLQCNMRPFTVFITPIVRVPGRLSVH